VITRKLIGHVDNSAYPQITVDIQLSLSTPANARGPVPVILEFGFGGRGPFRPGQNKDGSPKLPHLRRPVRPGNSKCSPAAGVTQPWCRTACRPITARGLTQGIIGLVNKGQPRKLDDWGALRAWGWGASRVLDYFETDKTVNAKQVGLEGHSRYGKAVLVAMADDARFAVAFRQFVRRGRRETASPQLGRARREIVAAPNEYHWMAGNFLKYAGPLTGQICRWIRTNSSPCARRGRSSSAPARLMAMAGSIAKGMFLAAAGAGPVYGCSEKRISGRLNFRRSKPA
jgi:hypothetical protein